PRMLFCNPDHSSRRGAQAICYKTHLRLSKSGAFRKWRIRLITTASSMPVRTSLSNLQHMRQRVTMRAPSFPLEDLANGEKIAMKDLWKSEIVVMEFGSFT